MIAMNSIGNGIEVFGEVFGEVSGKHFGDILKTNKRSFMYG